MKVSFFGPKRKIAIALIAVLLASSVPRSAQAQLTVVDFTNYVINTLDWVSNKSSEITGASIAANSNSMWVKEYVLDPLAWTLAQRMLQTVAGSVIKFVNGAINGTGIPQFVQNLQGHLQRVGDTVAGVLPRTSGFLVQFARNSNSPFAAAISSSLRTNYLQNTSLSGFYAANRCTLSRSSPNVNRFLAGDWSQGGASAWFALTTQDQNNPYALYQNAQSELGSLVGNAQAARSSMINQGQGFLSWCGVSSAASDLASSAGIDISDPCTNPDGSPGSIQTPGIVIHDQLEKVLGSGVDKMVASDEISEVLGQIAVNLVLDVLGGTQAGGLFGLSNPNSTTGGRSAIDVYTTERPQNPAGGPTPESSAISNAQSKIADINQYESDWDAIAASANSASAGITDLANYCTAQIELARSNSNSGAFADFISSNTAQVNSSQAAITNQVAPVLAQATQARIEAEKTRAMVLKIQSEASSTATSTATTLSADLSALQTMAPTSRDLASVNGKKQSVANAASILISTSPPGSLNVTSNSDQSLVDLMNLLKENAVSLRASCNLQAFIDAHSGSSGGD